MLLLIIDQQIDFSLLTFDTYFHFCTWLFVHQLQRQQFDHHHSQFVVHQSNQFLLAFVFVYMDCCILTMMIRYRRQIYKIVFWNNFLIPVFHLLLFEVLLLLASGISSNRLL